MSKKSGSKSTLASSLESVSSKGPKKKKGKKGKGKTKVVEDVSQREQEPVVSNVEPDDASQFTLISEEIAEQPPIPDFLPEMSVFDMIKKRIVVAGVLNFTLQKNHITAIEQFINDKTVRLLVAYNSPHLGFQVDNTIPTFVVNHICYFLKEAQTAEITSKNFLSEVQYGAVKGGHIESLLRLMTEIYAPIFFENSWPANCCRLQIFVGTTEYHASVKINHPAIKNDFSVHLHRFLATLTDTRWKLEGKTVLYVTTEGMKINELEASRNKELVRRLETSIIHWARQIKEVLTTSDAFEMAENSSPLDEIEFWRNRCADLSGITTQLDKEGVKRITYILELAKSSYVAPFLKLSGQIKDGSRQAESNLKYLRTLEKPCKELAEAKPKKIPSLLPKILHLIRSIWLHSDFYNTKERLTGILKKLSNEIIHRCCAEIDLDKVFDGYIITGMNIFMDSVQCCEEWKNIYDLVTYAHNKLSPNPWVLDHSAIFAQVDAFIQRCKHMCEVCQAHAHFGHQEDGCQAVMPHFAGHKWQEIIRDLLEIKSQFDKAHRMLRIHKKAILDVKDSSWHDIYYRFQTKMKDLEMMMQNTILSAFATIRTVQGGVEVIDVFAHLGSRQIIYLSIAKVTADTYNLFLEELNAAKKEMSNKDEYRSPNFPRYAGSAHYARQLKIRLQKHMSVLDRAFFLPKISLAEETRGQYKAFVSAVDEYIQKTYQEWIAVANKELLKLLEVPLMIRKNEKPPKIDLNFNGQLMKMMQESYYWECLGFDIPYFAADLYTRREDLKNMIERVLLIVRDYNRITSELSPEEHGLFKERLRTLDKNIYPGLTRLTWLTRDAAEYFINECRGHCFGVQNLLDSHKIATQNISLMCVQISELLLVKIDPRVIYENLYFEVDQARHREITSKKLSEIHDSILTILRQSFEVYKNDGPDVQSYWNQYTDKMDAMVEEAFRLNVKWSLQELLKAIDGDGKSTPNPLFKVRVVLEGDKVEFSPTLGQLATIVNDIGKMHLIDAIANIKHLPEMLSRRKSIKPPIHENVRTDDEVRKIITNINAGMQNNSLSLQNYLSTWDTYREIWEINKDAFMGRYQKLNPQNSSFDADIARYNEVANNVQMQETILNIQFVLLDCSPLKSSILSHCQEWQNKFTTLLSKIAINSLKDLTSYLAENSKKVCQVPQTLEELVASLNLWDSLHNALASIEEKFVPLTEQFAILDKYGVIIPAASRKILQDLPLEWENFQSILAQSDAMLKAKKEVFKSELLQQAADHKKQIAETLKEFETLGPFVSRTGVNEALENISVFSYKMESMKEHEYVLRHGLSIFKIDHPLSKDLAMLDKDLEICKNIWDLTKEWLATWDTWREFSFTDLNTAKMEETASLLLKTLNRISRPLKEKGWEIFESTKSKIDLFKRTIPLVVDLKNKAMRQRHWQQIQNEMNITFDHTSPDFKLEKITDFGFDHYSEFISEVSQSATKEVIIEQGLKAINTIWKTEELDIIPYKDKGMYKLNLAADLFQVLEENQMQLSAMKASQYVKPFVKDVTHWEKVLSHILEVTELLLTIQKHWMHLENIFIGEDIRKQLPEETAEFDHINIKWREIMARLNTERNAMKGTHLPGLLGQLVDINNKLDAIRRSLDLYLETKRHIFPRFYFISNDDLLDILGQSKNPEAVQPHLRKCFDSIKSLKMVWAKVGQMTRLEANGMFSLDGEYVDFAHPVILEGPVEAWLSEVEKAMKWTLKDLLRQCRASLKKSFNKRDKWFRDWTGQLCIVSSQIQWTQEVMKALVLIGERGDPKALKNVKKKQILMLGKYADTIRSSIPKIQRLKVFALVIVEVHGRDIIENLLKAGANDANTFEWMTQLRFYWEKEYDDCVIRQTNAHFVYGYEYLGNSGRLVITPLTERCYITLTTALNLHRGACIKGPASTGKTETVKDFGKTLGLYVLIVNCSDGLDYRSMAKFFAGLAQTGMWGSFDEMNRINIEVLSVIAQQILCILSALSAHLKKFVFEGTMINLVPTCGFFITMNPGYVGRGELPENLKSLFRPFAMVVPDTSLIAEIFLFAEGFNNTKLLAKKTSVLYSLAIQQLSKQDHYDFELRGIATMLKYAGRKKRLTQNWSDEEVLCYAMREMNVSRLKQVDMQLFMGILYDLFPDVVIPTTDYTKIKNAITEELVEKKLQVTQNTVTKVLQLLEAKNSRHAVMLIGGTLSAKSTVWRVLQSSLSRLHKAGEPSYQLVKEFPLNAKALRAGKLYGEFDSSSNEWKDGIFSYLLRLLCSDEKPEEKWIILDGPVDTQWVESINSLMDANKVLTLVNGERIALTDQVSLLFEVDELSMASQATISRASMVYCDYKDLGVMPYVESWISKKSYKGLVDDLKKCVDLYLLRVMEFKAANCKEPVPTVELNGVISMCRLFDALATVENGVELTDAGYSSKMVHMWFQFSLIWSVCASVDEDGRKKLDNCIREMIGTVPSKDTVYEYYVDGKTNSWVHWEDKLKDSWKYSPGIPFYKLKVPTVDTIRYQFLCSALIVNFTPVLMVGPVGTGKTLVLESTLANFDRSEYTVLTINMSAQTTTDQIQNVIESRVEKHTKGVYVPTGGKKLISFMDDLNMPAKDEYGFQPTLEILNMWLDYGFWFDMSKNIAKYIKGMLLIAAMGPPGGGRTVISPRLQSQFNLINMTFPQDPQLQHIFGSMINQKLLEFEEEVKMLGDAITRGTIEMYQAIVQRFLPTPTRIHYLFNLRDISRVFQGLLRANKIHHDTKPAILRLWMHECFRVFSDRLIDQKDIQSFQELLSEKLGVVFEQTFNNVCPNKVPPLFGDFMNPERVYEQIASIEALKAFMQEQLIRYNETPKTVSMDLVMFKDAAEHILRIVRVIRQTRGNILLIGISGVGRLSLSRLAAFLCEYAVFEIEVSEDYKSREFREDLKRLYFQTGIEIKPTVFIFKDIQAVEKSFFEDINCILSSGEVADMYKPEEFEEVKQHLLKDMKKVGLEEDTQSVLSFLIDRIRANLHLVLCMSPVGEEFRNSIRMFPAIVNYTTIDWFSEWPPEALLEVADKFLAEMIIQRPKSKECKPSLAQMFMILHKSVADYSVRMLKEMRRYNCVSSTNYLELVSGYKKLLFEKIYELTSERDKLRSGLNRIDDTQQKVEKMSVELEVAKVEVAAYQKQCDEFLKTLVQQKREADEQQKSVAVKNEKIKEEEIKCQILADVAQADLDEATPALDEANRALESLNKRDMTEIKSYGRPPTLVEKVMEAVMILRGNEPTWTEAKKQLGDQNFLKNLMNYDKDNITDRVLRKIGTFVAQADFHPEIIGNVSLAAKSLCMWVRAMEMYGRIYRVVEPKRIKLNAALAVLADKQAALADAKAKLAEVEAKLNELKSLYDEKLAQKEELKRKADLTELMLDRAQKLMSGLHSESTRWDQKVGELEEAMRHIIGDVLLAAAYMSYMGPFLSSFRDEIAIYWLSEVVNQGIPCAPDFNFSNFMTKPTQLREWNIQGLPRDEFSTVNAVIVTRSQRWSLMVDPQGQAIKWIKNMEANQGLMVVDIQKPNYLNMIKLGIQHGSPVLLTNVQEKLDPSLDPILNRSVIKAGGVTLIKLGDKEIVYDEDFRFYITTKLSNPLYTPEVLTKVAVVNFAVMDKGLEAQLLGIVVRKERPELEEQKDNLVCSIAAGKKKLLQCEEEILRLLNETLGSLLDDAQLVDTLQLSKATSQEVSESVAVSEQMEIKIDAAREGYRPCAQQASILFFILNDLSNVDPMYQYSLETYISLFIMSIEKSTRSMKLDERIVNLNEYHIYAIYKYVCRGLFEKHKLLFSFQMCVKLLEHSKKLNMDEYNFFLRGGIVVDKENQMDNPCTVWLSDESWDNITELDKLTNFHGLITSFDQYSRDWYMWYISPEPENTSLPGEWDKACNELQHMLLVRSLRPDRVSFCALSFITNNLGAKFIESPVLDMQAIVEDSITQTPLIFILSPGTDPRNSLIQLAETYGMSSRFNVLSLGQGQAPIATKLIQSAITEGKWIFLANCHLSLSWMPTLSQLVDQLQLELPHPMFRLWLSSSPIPEFPISVLQAGVKMTTEYPKGLKSGMKRLYSLITEQQFQRCHKPEKYRKLLFVLCFFHAVLLERKKFRMLGWNINYEFNDSDFEVSENLLTVYLDGYDEIQWEALKYLIANINYGGHVTDEWDRRLLMTYVNDYVCESVITAPFYKLSSLLTYYIPKDGPLSSYKEYVTMLPNTDLPEVFGQHPNAEISSQIQETRLLFDTLLSLQPHVSGLGGESTEEKVVELAATIFKNLPENMDYDGTAKILSEDPSPLNNVLLQEMQRYNTLLDQIRDSLSALENGIQGLVVMTQDLEIIFTCILDGRVPPLWEKAYPSLKPLSAWAKDLMQRVEMFAKWASSARPPWVFWLSAFIFPTGFLTAVLQVYARQHQLSVDNLSWEFVVQTVDDSNLTGPAKDGIYVKGLFLQGAAWERKFCVLIEASSMQLVCSMPTIQFKPVEYKKKDIYTAPCYYYPNRAGSLLRPSFVVAVDLRCGDKPADHWVKRGTALLMSLDY